MRHEERFEARLEERLRTVIDAEGDALCQAWGHRLLGADYDPKKYKWADTPPDPDTCSECYQWRRYPPGQRHFGWAYWRVCDANSCKHEHHQSEVWIA